MTGIGTLTHRATALADLWGEGYSGGEIAAKLKCSRGAVMGKIHRLRADRDPAIIAADKARPEMPNRMLQVADWMAEHDGRLCDCARDLGMGPKAVDATWKRIKRAVGAQAR